MMAQACPISREQRDERVARTVAFLVILIVPGALALRGAGGGAIMIALAIDFAIRAYLDPHYSPLAIVAKRIAKLLHLHRKPVDAAPKKFAAQIGLLFSIVIGTLLILHLTPAALAVSGVLLFCAFLEAAFGFCVGCEVYLGIQTVKQLFAPKSAHHHHHHHRHRRHAHGYRDETTSHHS